jgi:hypothetical protein
LLQQFKGELIVAFVTKRKVARLSQQFGQNNAKMSAFFHQLFGKLNELIKVFISQNFAGLLLHEP